MKVHPIAEIFPDIDGSEFQALVDDIQKNGCLQPLVMYQGKILDGRNRWRACQKLGITPKTTDYRGDDPVGFVLSLNLNRRHLNESQRAMVAARIATLAHGRPSKDEAEDENDDAEKGANLHLNHKTRPKIEETAKSLQVSPRTVKHARRVIEEGTKELKRAVERGEVAVSTAAKLVEASPEVQRAAVKDRGKAAPVIAKQIAEKKKDEEPAEDPIKSLGLDVPKDVLARSEKERALVDKMSRLLAELNRTYTEYEGFRGGRAGLKTGQRHASALRDALTAFRTIRGQRPASVCPHCKLIPEQQKTCAACRASGFIGEDDLKAVEECLMAEGDEAGIWINGKWHTLIQLRGDDF